LKQAIVLRTILQCFHKVAAQPGRLDTAKNRDAAGLARN